MIIQFEEFGLNISPDGDAGSFTGEFQFCELARAITSIRLEVWSRRHRQWTRCELSPTELLFLILKPQLEGRFEREIEDGLREYYGADNQNAMRADQKYDDSLGA